MGLFDIIGPVMVGPSSSHTAGAVRIGLMARRLLQEKPVYGEIGLHGSFADTGKGHGTDKALVAGILGMQPEDERIPDSYEMAKHQNFQFVMRHVYIKNAHPNTALIYLQSVSGKEILVQAASVGGGMIRVEKLDGIPVSFCGQCPTLVVYNVDKPGLVARIASVLAEKEVNIGTMQVHRERRGISAVTVVETDQLLRSEVVEQLKCLEGVTKVTYFEGMYGGCENGTVTE